MDGTGTLEKGRIMKRLVALLSLVMAVAVGQALSSDVDIRQMQERLAAQESRMAEQDARMSDLQAKIQTGLYGSNCETSADNIISLQKNAKVTVGGLVTTKYTYTNASVANSYGVDAGGDPAVLHGRGNRATSKTGSLGMSDAEVYLQVDVNDHFDAFVAMDLQNDGRDYFIAKSYYVRWKEICNTGFGLKVGRDALVFGEDNSVGDLATYTAGGGDGLSELGGEFDGYGGYNFGNAPGGGLIPLHNGWDTDGVVQVTPYWEGFDGKFSLELSFIQSVYNDGPYMDAEENYYYRTNRDGVHKTRSRNYGLGTMSMRATYQPIEDLKFTVGVVNYRSNGEGDGWDWVNDIPSYEADFGYAKNNTAFALAASWRPSFLSRLYLWGQYIHGNDVAFLDGAKSDAFNFGASFDLTENLVYFAQGDYLRTRYKFNGSDQKATAWAFYTGLQYSLPYGVSLEAGWKYENVRFKDGGRTTVKARGNTIYGLVGFEF